MHGHVFIMAIIESLVVSSKWPKKAFQNAGPVINDSLSFHMFNNTEGSSGLILLLKMIQLKPF